MIPLRDENPTRRFPAVTVALLVVNIGAFLFLQPQGKQLLGNRDRFVDPQTAQVEELQFNFQYAAVPCELTQGHPLTAEELRDTVVTGDDTACDSHDTGPEVFPDKNIWLAVLLSMFLHANLLHLGGNMLFLWIFGNNIEDHLGAIRYALFYLLGGIVAAGAHVVVQPDSTVPVIGASGAIAGVMGAYLVWFPNAPILTLFIFFLILFRRIRAKWLLAFWFVSQFFVAPGEGVAWVAHVGGFLFGVLVGLLVRGSRAVRRAAWRSTYADPVDPWR